MSDGQTQNYEASVSKTIARINSVKVKSGALVTALDEVTQRLDTTSEKALAAVREQPGYKKKWYVGQLGPVVNLATFCKTVIWSPDINTMEAKFTVQYLHVLIYACRRTSDTIGSAALSIYECRNETNTVYNPQLPAAFRNDRLYENEIELKKRLSQAFTELQAACDTLGQVIDEHKEMRNKGSEQLLRHFYAADLELRSEIMRQEWTGAFFDSDDNREVSIFRRKMAVIIALVQWTSLDAIESVWKELCGVVAGSKRTIWAGSR